MTSAASLIEALVKKNPEEYKGCVSLAVSRLSRVRYLKLCIQGKSVSGQHFEKKNVFQKTGFDISWKLSPKETIYMKCQSLLSRKNNIICHLLLFPEIDKYDWQIDKYLELAWAKKFRRRSYGDSFPYCSSVLAYLKHLNKMPLMSTQNMYCGDTRKKSVLFHSSW